MSKVSREAILEDLESIAQLLEIKGENVFKIRAYTNSARALQSFTGDWRALAEEGKLTEVPGIGEAIAKKIVEKLQTGEIPYYTKLKADFPPGIFELFELPGLGPKKIKAVWEKLGVTSLSELEVACKDGRLAELPGFGKKTTENFLKAIEDKHKHAGQYKLGEIAPSAEALLAELRELPEVLQAAIAGSYRRCKEIVRDLDYIVATNSPAAVSEFFVRHPLVESIIVHGPTKSSVRLQNGIQADLRVVTNEHFPFALAYFTGSKEHNIVVRNRAIARGWTLNEYRLAPDPNGKREPLPIPAIYTEAELHRALGLDYMEPELREDRGEVAAAEAHTLPELVQTQNLRGTFHNHTTASDGTNTLEEMAAAAQELGLQYLGIADHSQSSVYAHGLQIERLLAQIADIRRYNEEHGPEFRLFAGTEVDILKDGTLDYPDEVLAQLDYVVASLHNRFGLNEAEQTARIIRALESPNVTMMGHLTGRHLLDRPSAPMDVPAILEAAGATGTMVEINANPRRLELDWRWWPLAKEKGVQCVINPDAHSTKHLQFLHYGIGVARKGWLTRKDVVNCLPLGKVEAVLGAKWKDRR